MCYLSWNFFFTGLFHKQQNPVITSVEKSPICNLIKWTLFLMSYCSETKVSNSLSSELPGSRSWKGMATEI